MTKALTVHFISIFSLLCIFSFSQKSAAQDLVEIMADNPQLSRFLQVLQHGNYINELRAETHYTILAPNNSAFDQLDALTLRDLLHGENETQVRELIKTHLIEGHHKSNELSQMKTIDNLSGEAMEIVERYGTLRIDGTRIVRRDVQSSNGIVHIVDRVKIKSDMF